MSKQLGLWLRVAVSLGLVVAVIWRVDGAQLLATLGGASVPLTVAVVLLHTADRLLMAGKWYLLLRARHLPVTFGEAVRAYYISSFAGVFLPMTVGADVVRVGAMRGARVSSPTVIASIALERALGALSQAAFCLLSLAVLVSMQLSAPLGAARLAAIAVALLVIGTAALPLSFPLAARLQRRLADRPGIPGKLAALAGDYAAWRRHPAALWSFLVLTLLEGTLPIATYRVAAAALDVPTSLLQMLAVVPLVYLVARMPISVSGIGVEQSGFVGAAVALTVMPPAAAAAVSFLVSPITLLLALLPGALAWAARRRSL